jgi:acyl carrier protein
VELGEVESHLARLPDVHEAAVVLHQDAAGLPFLCAFFTASKRLDESDIQAALLRQLPGYMVPSVFHQLEAMPWTANQKLDRLALATMRPAPMAPRTGADLPPRTPVEAKVAAIFADVLGLPSVSADADFFELGGHSLRMMRLWDRIRTELGVEVELRQILDGPTVSRIASVVEHAPAAGTVRPKLVRQS